MWVKCLILQCYTQHVFQKLGHKIIKKLFACQRIHKKKLLIGYIAAVLGYFTSLHVILHIHSSVYTSFIQCYQSGLGYKLGKDLLCILMLGNRNLHK